MILHRTAKYPDGKRLRALGPPPHMATCSILEDYVVHLARNNAAISDQFFPNILKSNPPPAAFVSAHLPVPGTTGPTLDTALDRIVCVL
mmetsp:Transcript_15844/g.23855  ORF Transcript_15844/g.23855 Transcript_15844/m.23855 type:complete len:89 (-) Transcript_15844:536-802(-)